MEKEIIDYKLLSTIGGDLQWNVSNLIKQGWEPYGQPFVSHYGMHIVYQAMVLRK